MLKVLSHESQDLTMRHLPMESMTKNNEQIMENEDNMQSQAALPGYLTL